jgi:2-haloacid dehalogenase
MMAGIVVAFDLYGTLLSTASIAKELAAHFGQDKADSIAAVWRKYQLEYTWRLNSMSIYLSFFILGGQSLIPQQDIMRTSPT